MKRLLLATILATIASTLSSCVAANNNVKKDYDPPQHYRGRFWN